MTSINSSEAAKAVVWRNTEEVQGGGNFAVFEKLFADDFVDHTPQPGRTPVKDGARQLYKILRAAFPDFRAEIHWQCAEGDRVTTYKTYRGTHRGEFFRGADRPPHRVRDRRRHARARRQNRRALGRRQPVLSHAATDKEHHMTIGIIGSGAIGT